jgi:inorganic pyrophosphatase/exopolyphosphatase
MKIVTSGALYLDIDAYGGCIAYAELLRILGIDARAVSTAPLNESITTTVRSWGGEFFQDYQPQDGDTFAIIDVSGAESLDSIVDIDRVDTVIDHHVGQEDFWRQRIGSSADIEFIGAACTQVYEHWVRADQLSAMSAMSARLLMTGILDNTLGFRANVSTKRDRAAYEAMTAIAGLPKDWPALYFAECQAAIESQLEVAIRNDTKHLPDAELIKYHHLLPTCIGQLVVWNAQSLLVNRLSEIKAAMNAQADKWFVNVVSIEEGVSYIVAKDPLVQENITALLDLKDFKDGYAAADHLWLRKEILKAAFQAS